MHWALYSIRMMAFLSMMLGCSCIINCLQFLGLFLRISRPHYRTYMRFTQRLFGSLILVATYLFAPLQIILTGHHQDLNSSSFVPIMANHQIYTDWWYIWLFSWFRNAHGELKIILKQSLGWIPILGWGMRFFEFLFLARDWNIDQKRLLQNLSRSKTDGNPMWLLIFPEGTVITRDTIGKSKAYAQKQGIQHHPEHVLIPKSTGLYHIIRCLDSQTEFLYDFTIGYSGLSRLDCPFDTYPPSKVFYQGNGPKAIHIHVDRFRVTDIPGIHNHAYHPLEPVDPLFTDWLRNRFLEKDVLLKYFYKHKQFQESIHDDGVKQILHINPDYVDWISIAALLFTSFTSWSWLL
jgi:lysocardiolipin and lysophospholipid acyltransferase